MFCFIGPASIFTGRSSRSSIIVRPAAISVPRPRQHVVASARMSTNSSGSNALLSAPVERGYVKTDANGLPVLQIEDVSKRPSIWLVSIIAAIAAFAVWLMRRVIMLKRLSQKYVRKDLNMDIAAFYDLRSAAWESVWGEHMHHGLYDVVNKKKLKGQAAQIRTMSELLKFSNTIDLDLPSNSKILDLGCGIGGSSRFLARHFGENCHVTGVTLSPYQANRANELNEEKGLGGRVKNEVRDALSTGFGDEQFEIIWSMESGEHIQNKRLLMQECARMLKSDGRLLMVAWCARESKPPFSLAERYSIRRIMEEYCLPNLSSPSEYSTEMVRAGLRDVKVEDWTQRAAPFWGEVFRSALFNPRGWKALAKNGWPLIKSALAMRHVMTGIRLGVFRLVAFSARKATQEEIQAEKERVGELSCRSASSLPSPSPGLKHKKTND